MAKIKVKPRTLLIIPIAADGDPVEEKHINNVAFTFTHETTVEIFFMDGSITVINTGKYRVKRIN